MGSTRGFFIGIKCMHIEILEQNIGEARGRQAGKLGMCKEDLRAGPYRLKSLNYSDTGKEKTVGDYIQV